MGLRSFVALWFCVGAALVCVLPTGVALGVWGLMLLASPPRFDPPHRGPGARRG